MESLIYIHSKNIIHRDIKPENLIFDDKGYLHVTDFGIAKFSNGKTLNETSGTPGYMAPEVMKGLNHTGSVDYFALGVITYELMQGKRPYIGKNRKEIKEQMMLKQVYLDDDNIPLGWSQEAADFINRLLVRKETSRLGYYNDNEIKRHPWLSDINFEDLLQGKIRAPFIPRKNYDNYDKKYCQEVEEVGIGTNMRYEHYRNNERYPLLFEGFTYYNVDESKLIPCNDIYRKPNVKYVKSYSSINTSNNYIINKSKTINLDYDYKRRINENMLNNRIPSANNISMRTIHYSNGNEMNSNKVQISNLKRNQSSLFINDSKYNLKNADNIYIMASPNRRGRISINNDDNNIDNNFRKYANHSFVETNYSKGKTIRRSYSSSNLYSNNCVNVFNLMVNNVNNINNNNILISNSNNNSSRQKQNYPQPPKYTNPINYNNTNRSRIPIIKNNTSNNHKNIGFSISSYNNRNSNEKTKNSSFSNIQNDNCLYSDIKNKNYENNSFRYSRHNLSLKNNNLNNIDNIEPFESEKKNYQIPDRYKNLRRNHSYSYVCYFKNDIPRNSINKIQPIYINDKDYSYKNEIIPNTYNSNNNNININYNKIKKIENINNKNIPNSSKNVDKYKINKEINKDNNKVINSENIKDINIAINKDFNKNIFKNQSKDINIYSVKDHNKKKEKIQNYDNSKNSQENDKMIRINPKINVVIDNHSNKRAPPPPPINHNNSYNNIIDNKVINNNLIKNEENKIINVPKSPKINQKNNTYKKIQIPFPLNQKIKRKKLILNNDFSKTIKSEINMTNKTINILPLKTDKYMKYMSYYPINNKENIKSNLNENLNIEKFNLHKTIEYNQSKYQIPIEDKPIVINKNININQIINPRPKMSIMPMKINEKNIYGYQYLRNFDKYKKIKNNNNINKNKIINYNKKVVHPNIIKKKISDKYHTNESKEINYKQILIDKNNNY